MKPRLALIVAGLQVLALAFMAGQREWIMHFGTPLVLRTAPIDPDDPMRGAYVRLDYEMATVPPALCRGEVAKWTKATDYRVTQRLRDKVVYAAVKVSEYGIAELTMLSDVPPPNGPYLRGRVVSADTNGVQVRYGIEALFMEKEAAQKMEAMAAKEKAGAPINARIAVGSSGTAVLQDAEFEPLGLTITLDPRPRRENNDPQRWQPQPLTGLTVTLHNYSDGDIAIVNLPGARSFRMVRNTRFGSNPGYEWASATAVDGPAPVAGDIIVLKSGGTHAVHLDLTQEQWWVIDTRKPGSAPMPLQKVTDGWSASFRMQYTPPGAEAVRGLPHAELVRHAPLRSRAFNASQGVD